MKKWNELSMADRARYIKLGVENGITSIKDISDAYNVYADGGNKSTIDSFRESILPIPMDEYIKENYGYRRYKIPEPIDSIPQRKNRLASVDSNDSPANNIPSTKAEPYSTEVSVSKPGTYFPLDWRKRPNTTIDDDGNFHTDLPDVYQIDDKPLTFGDWLYKSVTSAMNANPLTSDTRVDLMKKADMRNYHDLSPRQTASVMSLIGNFIKPVNPPIGYGLQLFDLGFDAYDAVFNPSIGNTFSLVGDIAGFDRLTRGIRPFNLPSFNFPSWTFTDGEGNRLLSIPGGTIGGQTVNPTQAVNALKAFGVADDIASSLGYDLLDFNKAEDPDTIRIHKTPQGGYGEYIHTPWDEFNKRKKNEYKKGGGLSNRERIAAIIASNPKFKNVNLDKALSNYEDSIAERNSIELPELTITAKRKNKNQHAKYTVKAGDNLSKIAKENNYTLDELIGFNPQIKNINNIHVGDEIRLGHDYESYNVDIRKEEEDEKKYNQSDMSAIQHFSHEGNYGIVDKKNNLFTVYDKDNNLLFQTNNISTGKSGDDYNTITYVDKNGKIINNLGNNSTPAGITQITGTGMYHGFPSFTRGRSKGETTENIASSLHWGKTDDKKASNGCVRVDGEDLKKLADFIGVGTRIYTLPEKEGSRFTLKNGRLNFTADNPYGIDSNYGEYDEKNDKLINKRFWDDYNVHIDKSYSPLVIVPKNIKQDKYSKNAIDYANTLSTNKEQLQRYFNLTSNEYNKLAQLAIGIAHQESKFGTSHRYKAKQNINDDVVDIAQFVRGLGRFSVSGHKEANSKGITQIKYDADIKSPELFSAYNEFGINKESLQSVEGASLGTLIRLAYMYNSEVKGRTFKGENDTDVNPYDALLYKYNGHNEQLRNKTATPETNTYINNVKKAIDKFNFFEERKRRK